MGQPHRRVQTESQKHLLQILLIPAAFSFGVPCIIIFKMDEIFGILKIFDKLIKIIYEVYTAWYQRTFFILYVWPTHWFLQVVLIEGTASSFNKYNLQKPESRKNPFEGLIDCVHFSARDLGRSMGPGRSMFGKGGESLPLLQRPPPPGGGLVTLRKIGWGCAARFPKPLPYLWPKSVICPTLFMTWPKIRNPIYDPTLTSKSCFRPAFSLVP